MHFFARKLYRTATDMKELKKFIKGFGYAFQGVFTALKTECNMRVHLVCMIYMYFFLFAFDFFEITRTQLAIIFIANGLVVGGELINTAIEAAVDLHGKEHTLLGKIAKDTAAGAVLVFAVSAVACGIAIMYQPPAFGKLFYYFSTHIFALTLFIVSLAAAIAFILFGFGKKEKK